MNASPLKFTYFLMCHIWAIVANTVITFLRDVIPSSLVERHQYSVGTSCFHFHGTYHRWPWD